jgi:hypothetical protein
LNSGAGQRNVGAFELAVGPHRDGLPTAAGRQRDVGVEAGRAGDDLNVAAGSATLDAAADAAAAFGPVSGNLGALGHDIRLQLELIAVAGAGEGHVEPGAAVADGIGRTAANALAGSVVEHDGSTARPDPGEAVERPRLCVTRGTRDRGREQCDGPEYQSSDDRKTAGRLARLIAAMLAIDRCKVRPLMPHSTSPILRCH